MNFFHARCCDSTAQHACSAGQRLPDPGNASAAMGKSSCLRALLCQAASSCSTPSTLGLHHTAALQQLQQAAVYDSLLLSQSVARAACWGQSSIPAWPSLAACCRHYSTQPSKPDSSTDTSSIGNEKVRKLADDILALSVLESSWLTEILRKKLNLQKPAFGAMPAFPMAAAGAAPAAPAAAAGAKAAAPAKEEKKEEKTTFEVKLESFSADGKIKVIKEVRAITSLGLKEAKELVEKAPVVIKGSVAKADAENMKKLIEAAGGKVSLL